MRGLPALLACAAASVALAACAAPAVPDVPAPPPPGGLCNDTAAQFAVGILWGEALTDEVRRKSGARIARVLRPGQVVTMEYSPERVTLDLDGSGRVTRVRCG